MNRTILICGAPTVGKTTMAKMLSAKFDLPWMSTDVIRDIMKTIADPKQHPKLFTEGHETAESFLGAFSAQRIAEMEIEQGTAVWPGIRHMIDTEYSWSSGTIIEGVNLLPELIARDYPQNNAVRSVLLIDHDEERMRRVVFQRGLWDRADTYSDDVKEKEVEWAMLCSKMLEKQAIKHDVPIVEVTKDAKKDLLAVLEVIGEINT